MTNSSSLRFTSVVRACAVRCWLGLLLVGLAGCAGGGISMVATIAGGERIAVPLGRGGAEPAQVDGVKIQGAGCTLNSEKNLVFSFAFSDAKARALRSVRVEDVSDDAPFLLVEDLKPVVPAGSQWRGVSRPVAPSEPILSWIATISNTLRVFRFTLTFADGRTLTLHQGTLYPGGSKVGLRRELGMNY